MKQLKERVKALRQKRGWSQEDLAREIDVSLTTIQRWETRGAKPTRLARKELEKLFKQAGMDSEDKR
ncbi:MAG: helix-turn-helix transcriptional regulator [Dehalococcoidales bacterium]|nr:helix-turn-helix transcriptional regulator [Dehalococcoidales bacterium]